MGTTMVVVVSEGGSEQRRGILGDVNDEEDEQRKGMRLATAELCRKVKDGRCLDLNAAQATHDFRGETAEALHGDSSRRGPAVNPTGSPLVRAPGSGVRVRRNGRP